MQIIDLQGKKWVVGLDWEILPGDAPLKVEAKEIANRVKLDYGLLVDYEGQAAIGLAKKSSKIPSAAAYLSIANQDFRAGTSPGHKFNDWIVVEDVGEDRVWMSVIKGGIPSPQFDKLFDITTAREKILELLINDTYILYSTSGEIISIFDSTKPVEKKSIIQLTQGIENKLKYLKLRGLPDAVMYGSFAAMGLVALGIVGGQVFDGYNLKQKAAAAQKQKQEDERRAQELYLTQMTDYENTLRELKVKARSEVLTSISASPKIVLSAWHSAIGNIPFGTHGWTMDSATCGFDSRDDLLSSCTISFKRTGLTTNRMLLQDFPDADIAGNNATVKRAVELGSPIQNIQDEGILDTLLDAKTWKFNVESQLQLLKIALVDHELKASSPIVIQGPPKPQPPVNGMGGPNANLIGGMASAVGAQIPNQKPAGSPQVGAAETMPIGIEKGEIQIRSDNFDLIQDIAETVDFRAVGVRSATFKFASLGSINWNVVMDYYIAAGSGSISSSDSTSVSSSALEDKKSSVVASSRRTFGGK